MEHLFFEVFPNLTWKDEMHSLFETTEVQHVALNRDRTRLKVCLSADHLIHAKKAYEAENLLRKHLCPERDSFQVVFRFTFCLSGEMTLRSLWDNYENSIAFELKRGDLLLYELYRMSKPVFSGEHHLTMELPMTILAEERADDLVIVLSDILLKRCGISGEIDYILKERKHRMTEQPSVTPMPQEKREAEKEPDIPAKEPLPEEKKEEEKKEKKAAPKKKGLLYGKDFKEDPIPLDMLTEDNEEVVVRGKLLSVSTRLLKQKKDRDGNDLPQKALVLFTITDLTDSIECKLFIKAEKAAELEEGLNQAGFIQLKGILQFDTYNRELVMSSIRGIKEASDFFPKREDRSPVKRVELHCHTKMSDMDGVSDVKDIIAQAIRFGHKALAITDHGVVQAFTEGFHALPKGTDFKLLYGVEGYLVDDTEVEDRSMPGFYKKLKSRHIILIAKNDLGRINLYRLVSISHLETFYKKPLMLKTDLMKYREGILLGSACEAGELFQAILNHEPEEKIEEIARFYDYLEVQPIGNNAFLMRDDRSWVETEEDLRDLNRKIVSLGERLNKPVAATCDVHFLNPEDSVYRMFIQAGNGFTDAEQQAPLYLHTTEEMLDEFSYLGRDKAYEVVVETPGKIADMCERIEPVRPDKCPPVIENSDVTLREICESKAREIYGDPLPEVVSNRLNRELNSIIGNGYAVMYIIAQKLVWKSNDDGYLVGSRGSVGSSFAATMAGITEVNPLHAHYLCPNCHYTDFDSEEVRAFDGRSGSDMPDKNCPLCGQPLKKDGFDIPFETFLGFKGNKEPDIDLNFSGDYQSKAHAYTEVIFGKGQTYRAGTITGLAEKTAFGYVKNFYEERGVKKRKCEIERLLTGCVGIRKSTGQHPGGIIVLPKGEEIETFTPIQKPANKMDADSVTTHFDYHSIEHNLLKLDILGHDDPTMIKRLEELTGINARTIPLSDPKVMSLFQNTEALGITPEDIGGTKLGALGIPEFGTDFAMDMLLDTKPKELSDLIRIAGLAHGTDVWIGNAQELIRSGKATIKTAICTRDDIMTYLIGMGIENETAFKIMESVRKGKVAKGKCAEWEGWKAELLAHGVPDWYIWSCERIKYMFPKAHAAAYVMMAWRIAWCKVYQPLAYYAAYFSIRADAFSYELMCCGEEQMKENIRDLRARADMLSAKESGALYVLRIVEEMYARGYSFTPIVLEQADARYFKIVDGKIMPSFASIDKMGTEAANSIPEALKDGPFLSRQDFKNRTKVTQTVIDKMNEMGMFEGLPETNQMQLSDFF